MAYEGSYRPFGWVGFGCLCSSNPSSNRVCKSRERELHPCERKEPLVSDIDRRRRCRSCEPPTAPHQMAGPRLRYTCPAALHQRLSQPGADGYEREHPCPARTPTAIRLWVSRERSDLDRLRSCSKC